LGGKGEKAKRRKGLGGFFIGRGLPAAPIGNFHRQIVGDTDVSPVLGA
jgi:hypothetical protein